ncbi:MAG: glycosyltransferase [Pseudomonadota bacterium]
MIFLDINTFFSSKAGGIRTYHQAKIAWFQGGTEHHYYLVSPGPKHQVRKLGPRVTLVEVYGIAVTGDPSGYRILLDYVRIFDLIRHVKPDVLEAGDPWFTGLFCLALKKFGLYKGLLVSFYHSDPIPSYLVPWARRGRFRTLKRVLASLAGRLFYRMQSSYDLTTVSSRTMEVSLRKRGIRSVAYLPFGVPAAFLISAPNRGEGRFRLLYAGRLDREKGIELLIGVLPRLLDNENVEVSVIGWGSFTAHFLAYAHPRFTYLGFFEDPEAVRGIYDRHDILLAPGPFETFGLGVLEAMARGLVVVGPDGGGTGELLRQAASPYMFKSGDQSDFLRAVKAALADNLTPHSERSRALALRYGTLDESVGRMADHYTSHPGLR